MINKARPYKNAYNHRYDLEATSGTVSICHPRKAKLKSIIILMSMSPSKMTS